MRTGSLSLLTRMPNGMVCNNAGIDAFGVGQDEVCLLPVDPDESAKVLLTYLGLPVVISDTQSRWYRAGVTNVAIGSWGLAPIQSYIGQSDAFGNVLQKTAIAVVDELATAADLVMGKTDGIPAAVVRGYPYTPALEDAKIINDSRRYSQMEIAHGLNNKPTNGSN